MMLLCNKNHIRSVFYNLCLGVQDQTEEGKHRHELLELAVNKASDDPFGSWLLHPSGFRYAIPLRFLFDFFEHRSLWHVDWFELYLRCLDHLICIIPSDTVLGEWEAVEQTRENIPNSLKKVNPEKERVERWLIRLLRYYYWSLQLESPVFLSSIQRHTIHNLVFLLELGADSHTCSYRLNCRWYTPTVCAEDLGITDIWKEALAKSPIDMEIFFREEGREGKKVISGLEDKSCQGHGIFKCNTIISYGLYNGSTWYSSICRPLDYYETQASEDIPRELGGLGDGASLHW